MSAYTLLVNKIRLTVQHDQDILYKWQLKIDNNSCKSDMILKWEHEMLDIHNV